MQQILCYKKSVKSILTALMLVFTSFAFAQGFEQPVTWSGKAVKAEGNVYEIQLTANIEGNWHIYDLGPYDGPPNPTTLKIEETAGIKLVGTPYITTEVHKAFDDIFNMEIGTCASGVVVAQKVEVTSGSPVSVKANIEWQACDDGNCLPPTDVDITVNLPAGEGLAPLADVEEVAVSVPDSSSSEESDKSLWAVILEAIAWGFVALLTPCVFPMVPMTVSFFLKNSGGKAKGRFMASLYGISIVSLYTIPIAIIIFITYFVGGDAVTADIFNWLATHWIPNIIFFAIFMVFAASFFGAFEITMPSWLVNKADSKSDKGGIIGVFFMALTLVLVSFSCTGPIVGNVVILSLSGQFWTPILTMLAFSTAFALPFALLALFPAWLSKLPKSGGWLATVKVVLGFVEVALAFKFLSMADQAYHWGILPRDLYLLIWIVDAFLLLLFMLGAITFPGVDKVRKWGAVRIVFTGIVAAFLVYMVTGLFGAPLKALSGYLPPMETKGWFYDNRTYQEMEDYDPAKVKYGDKLHLAHDLNGFFDLEQARDYAHHVGKPLFIDFTGHACVNCREMEQRVWSDPTVQQILREDYVIVALYCDDKMTISEEDWIVVGDKTLKTLGKVNSHIAFAKYGVNAQPCYILESPDGKLLAAPRGYDLDVDAFVAFLRGGLEKFNNK